MQDNQPPKPEQPLPDVTILEFEEFAFAETSARFARLQSTTDKEAADHIRGALHMHRFILFSWLLLNGVTLPSRLLDDRTHPKVGKQKPDQPA